MIGSYDPAYLHNLGKTFPNSFQREAIKERGRVDARDRDITLSSKIIPEKDSIQKRSVFKTPKKIIGC